MPLTAEEHRQLDPQLQKARRDERNRRARVARARAKAAEQRRREHAKGAA